MRCETRQDEAKEGSDASGGSKRTGTEHSIGQSSRSSAKRPITHLTLANQGQGSQTNRGKSYGGVTGVFTFAQFNEVCCTQRGTLLMIHISRKEGFGIVSIFYPMRFF